MRSGHEGRIVMRSVCLATLAAVFAFVQAETARGHQPSTQPAGSSGTSSSLEALLQHPCVRKEQKNKLKIIADETAKEARMLFFAGTRVSFPEAMKKVDTVRRKAVDKGVAILTEEQRKAWDELVGEPFEVPSERPLIRQPAGEP